MTSDQLSSGHGPGGADREQRAWTSQDLAALDDLVTRVRERPFDLDQLALEVELDTAREELRVADEEIRAQRDQLDTLLAAHQAGNVQRRRVASLLPLPVLLTDVAGRIHEANAAAAVRLNVPLARLVGKPLPAFVREEDRGAVRSALSHVDVEPTRVPVVLVPRRSEPVAVDLVLTVEPGAEPDALVQWTVLSPSPAEQVRGAVAGPLRLAAAVAEISRLPVGETDMRSLLGGFVRAAATALDASTSLSVNLGRPAEPTQVATTSEEAAAADGLQIRAGQGPCVDAYDGQESVLVDDLRTDTRWPRLRAMSGESPVRSALAVPILVAGAQVGVLNCYSTAPHAFTDDQAQTADVLALAAGAALEAVQETAHLRRLAEQLDEALASRAVIDQAKGIVMARRGCTAEEAFAHLAALSQHRNVKLRDLARALVEQTAAAPPVIRRRS
jgi:GAF domain-containing protein